MVIDWIETKESLKIRAAHDKGGHGVKILLLVFWCCSGLRHIRDLQIFHLLRQSRVLS
jgi:hypothetical protein